MKRAIATAGDLAHGLKTPLAVLVQEADRASGSGQPRIGRRDHQQVERMSRQVNYQLARARAAASGGASAARSELPTVPTLWCAPSRNSTPDAPLQISCNLAPDLWARVQREDLDEMLGNLLDNACKWANSRMIVEASRSGAASGHPRRRRRPGATARSANHGPGARRPN